jgi:hypothetical protein
MSWHMFERSSLPKERVIQLKTSLMNALDTVLQRFPKRTNPKHKNPECKDPSLFSGIYVIIPNVKILNPELS